MWEKFTRSNFLIKLRNWEYWPFGIIQFPFFLYWLWLSLKARSLFFFSASNPEILMGGMMGESKFGVLQLVPESVKPKSLLVRIPITTSEVTKIISTNGLSLPLIFKPDIGERGWMVRVIKSSQDIDIYLKEIKINFIIQELVDLPLEFGVFYVRFPNEARGRINSITMKEFLHVTGDGTTSLKDLILAKDRAKLQWDSLRAIYESQLDKVLADGERLELIPIGNHCLGTKFLNGNHLITEKLNDSFDQISKQIKGFYFGRYDLRCASFEDLEKGRIRIMELNGCGAEPAHIYHPGASLREALRVLSLHWRNLYLVSVQNHALGVPYLSFKEGSAIYRRFKAIKSLP